MKLVITTLFIVISNFLWSQEIIEKGFYKDKFLTKPCDEKKAKYLFEKIKESSQVEHIKIIELKRNLIVREERRKGDFPIGIWTYVDYKDEKFETNYDKLKYIEELDFDSSTFKSFVPAEYPGGENGIFNFLQSKTVYHYLARDMGIQGIVKIQFKVDKEGNAIPITITESVSPFLDIGAWETIEKMDKWKPAIGDNKPAEMLFTIPIRYVLM